MNRLLILVSVVAVLVACLVVFGGVCTQDNPSDRRTCIAIILSLLAGLEYKNITFKVASKESCDLNSKQELPPCEPTATWYAPDQCDCTKFYQCFYGTVSHFSCPSRGAWNTTEEACIRVYTENPAFCEDRPFKLTYGPDLYAEYNFTVRNMTASPYHTILSIVDSAPKDVVYNVMAYLAGARDDFTFTTSYNTKFWYQIMCINNVCADYSRDQTYWSFTIDGQVSNLGVSSVVADSGSVIGFDLTKA